MPTYHYTLKGGGEYTINSRLPLTKDQIKRLEQEINLLDNAIKEPLKEDDDAKMD